MRVKKVKKLLFLAICMGVLFVFISNKTIQKNAKTKLYTTASEIPKNKVGLLLGTTKYLSNGQINFYYKFRVDAAVKLFEANKIDVIIVSGDNGRKEYDEPTDFKNDLIKLGIPGDKIVLDYAGFRTLDSVVRAKEVFGQSSITIISQKFHNERAIYLAEHFGLKAIGFNAQKVSGRLGLRVTLREYLARVKVFIDILTRKQPKFLGKSISID